MPDRIVRDELLTSERYWSVSMQAQQMYVHLLLVVDDAARFSGKNFTLRAACFPGRPMEAADLERMLAELADVDLIRLYTVGAERFVFLPRFRNRRRYVGASKYPNPPNEINDLPSEKSTRSQPEVNPKSTRSQPEVSPKSGGVGEGLGLGKRISKASPSQGAGKPSPAAVDEGRFPDFWSAWPKSDRKQDRKKCLAKWRKLGADAYADRIISHVLAMAATKKWRDGYDPLVMSYLNGERWEDPIPPDRVEPEAKTAYTREREGSASAWMGQFGAKTVKQEDDDATRLTLD